MRAFAALALVFAVVASTAVVEDEAVPDFSDSITSATSDSAAVKVLEAFIAAGGIVERDEAKDAIEHAIGSGWWAASEKIIEVAGASGVDVSTAVHQTASSVQKRLQHLKDILGKTPGAVSAGIPPAFEWAQSPDSLFLNVKFAHKLDTPATLGCALGDSDVKIEERSLSLRAACAAQKKVFSLGLSLLRDISPSESSWSMLSVGRVQITLRKAGNGTWPRLLRSSKKPAHMHVWWAMKEKHEGALEAWERDAAKAADAAAAANATANATAGEAGGAEAVNATAALQDAISGISAATGGAAAAPLAASPAAATPAVVQAAEEDEEVLEAEDAGSANAPPAKLSASSVEDAPAPSGGSSSSSGKQGKSDASPTKESAAAKRRRLAREKAAREKKAAAAGAGDGPNFSGGPGGDGEGPFGGARSFTSEQLFSQLASSITGRERSEIAEARADEKKTLARIESHLKKEKGALRNADPEARQLEAARLDAEAAARKAEARHAAASKVEEIKAKFKAEYDDLRSKLNMGGSKEGEL